MKMLKLYGFTYQCVEKKIEVAWKIENLKIFKILCWENDRDLDHVPDLCGAVKSSDFFHHFSCSFSSGVRSICLIFPSEFTPFFFFNQKLLFYILTIIQCSISLLSTSPKLSFSFKRSSFHFNERRKMQYHHCINLLRRHNWRGYCFPYKYSCFWRQVSISLCYLSLREKKEERKLLKRCRYLQAKEIVHNLEHSGFDCFWMAVPWTSMFVTAISMC